MQNLHIHSTFCDGHDSVEDMARAAFEAGFDSIGFSSHSYMPFSKIPSLSPERIPDYFAEVKRLKNIYAKKMNIYTGIEFEMLCETDLTPFDYVIGACHYFHIGDEFVGFDRSADEVERVINVYFGGDGMKYAKMYYETLATLPEKGKIDIIAHFDLITKHIENRDFFDSESAEYKNYVLSAMDALIDKIPLLEINTGAIGRGYRTSPYPSAYILREWKKRGGHITVSSDCHNKEKIAVAYPESFALAKECGFREIYTFDGNGFVSETIK